MYFVESGGKYGRPLMAEGSRPGFVRQRQLWGEQTPKSRKSGCELTQGGTN